MKGDEFDPKGLIFEAYRIDGITKSECRTIFLDWALSIPIEADQKSMIQILCRMPLKILIPMKTKGPLSRLPKAVMSF